MTLEKRVEREIGGKAVQRGRQRRLDRAVAERDEAAVHLDGLVGSRRHVLVGVADQDDVLVEDVGGGADAALLDAETLDEGDAHLAGAHDPVDHADLVDPVLGISLHAAVDDAERLDRPRRLQGAVPRVDALDLHGIACAVRRLDAKVCGFEHPIDVHGAVKPVGVGRVLQRRDELAAFDPELAVGHHAVDLEAFEGVDEHDIGVAARRDHTHVVVHPIELGRLDGGHLDRGHRVQAVLNGDANCVVHLPALQHPVWRDHIGAELVGAGVVSFLSNHRKTFSYVLASATFSNHDPDAELGLAAGLRGVDDHLGPVADRVLDIADGSDALALDGDPFGLDGSRVHVDHAAVRDDRVGGRVAHGHVDQRFPLKLHDLPRYGSVTGRHRSRT